MIHSPQPPERRRHSHRHSKWRNRLESLREWTGHLLRRFGRRIRRRVRKAVDFIRDITTFTGFVRFWKELPQDISRWASRTWTRIRDALGNPRHWMPAVPAFAGVLFWVAFAIYVWVWWTPEAVSRDYQNMAGQAFARSDFERARIACERMIQLAPDERPKALFGIAVALEKQGKQKDAISYMRHVAPVTGGGYAPAHLYLARQLLTSTNLTPDRQRIAVLHLQHAVQLDPHNSDANLLLGTIYFQQGTKDLAKEHLIRAVDDNHDALLPVAQLMASQNDPQTEMWATKAVAHFREQMENSNALEPRIRCAAAMTLLKDYAGAVTLLERGYERTTNAVYRMQLGGVFAEWAGSIVPTPTNVATRAALVERGLRYTPANEALLWQLVQLAGLNDQNSASSKRLLQELVTQGTAGATLHFCLGVDAWQRRQLAEAREHLEIAFKLAPQMPYIGNNLATVLIAQGDGNAQRALAIMESVMEQHGNEPLFHETRGQVLAKLKRWKEAALEFEKSMPAAAQSFETHRTMSTVYAQLGMKSLSEEHQRIATKLAPKNSQ